MPMSPLVAEPGPPGVLLDPFTTHRGWMMTFAASIPAIDGVATFSPAVLALNDRRHAAFVLPLSWWTRAALDAFGVQMVILPDGHCRETSDRWGLPIVAVGEKSCAIRNPTAADRYELIGEAMPVESEERMLDAVLEDPATSVPVVGLPPMEGTGVPGLARSEVRLVSYAAGRIELAVQTSHDAFLLVRHAWSPGWFADVDGRRTALYPASGLYFGLAVPPGAKRIQLRFETPGLRSGLSVTVLWLVLMAVLAGRSLHARSTQRRGA